jgi:hypothetical protein
MESVGTVLTRSNRAFSWASRHKGLLQSGGIAPRILDLDTRWRWMSASHSGRFPPREKAAGNHWIGGWVDPRTGLEKFPATAGTRTTDHPARKPALYHWAILAPHKSQPLNIILSQFSLSNPHHYSCFFKINLNIIVLSIHKSRKFSSFEIFRMEFCKHYLYPPYVSTHASHPSSNDVKCEQCIFWSARNFLQPTISFP